MRKPRTEKQKIATTRNWQILQIKGLIANTQRNELIHDSDKYVIINLLNNSLVNSKRKRELDLSRLNNDYLKSYINKKYKPSFLRLLINALKTAKRKRSINKLRNK